MVGALRVLLIQRMIFSLTSTFLILEGNTKGYNNHPQLHRFKNADNPLVLINKYLESVYNESVQRAYVFDASKFSKSDNIKKLSVTSGQLEYEFRHLLNKLKIRDQERWLKINNTKVIKHHPLFIVVKGNIEDWEITS